MNILLLKGSKVSKRMDIVSFRTGSETPGVAHPARMDLQGIVTSGGLREAEDKFLLFIEDNNIRDSILCVYWVLN